MKPINSNPVLKKVPDIDERIRKILDEYKRRGECVVPVWVLCRHLGLSPKHYPDLLDYLEANFYKHLMPALLPHRTYLLNPKANRRSVKKHGTWKFIPVRYLRAVEGTKWAGSAISLIATYLYPEPNKIEGGVSRK